MARDAPSILAGPCVSGECLRLCWAPRPPLRHAVRLMDALPETLRSAFDPERFRRDGHALVDQLADYLRAVTGREGPVLPWAEPEANLAAWSSTFPEKPG